jgi:hypothetical protein
LPAGQWAADVTTIFTTETPVPTSRCGDSVPAAVLFDALDTVPAEPLSVRIGDASLIQLRRQGRCYVWSSVATARFASPR